MNLPENWMQNNQLQDPDNIDALLEAADLARQLIQVGDHALDDFYCDLGRSIANYDEFAGRLKVDLNVQDHEVEKVYDEHGEAEAFFNKSIYTTGYKNIYLVTSENFDTKDNDYIEYRLLFRR